MKKLRQAIKEAGLTQGQVAETLGVSAPLVNHWVQGRQRVPQHHADALQALLGVEIAPEVDYGTLMDEARTALGYVILWPMKDVLEGHHSEHVRPHTGRDAELRVKRWTAALRPYGVNQQELVAAMKGEGLLPITAIEAVADMQKLLANPSPLAEQAGFKRSEFEAVTQMAEEMQTCGTFEAAQEVLQEARTEFLNEGLRVNAGHAMERLDNGEEIDDPILLKFLGGVPIDAIVQLDTAQSGQDLTGRFRSMEL